MSKVMAVVLAVLACCVFAVSLHGAGSDNQPAGTLYEGFRAELLLQGRIGKHAVITQSNSAQVEGEIAGVDSLRLFLSRNGATLSLPLDSLQKIEFKAGPETGSVKILAAIVIAPLAILGFLMLKNL